jgi:DNA-binding NtrC family response regulator
VSLEMRTVGIVEDDPIMGESLVQCLELAGSKVTWWTTGREAIAGVQSRSPDLVVCDIRLPDIDGAMVFDTLARSGPIPPFLFMTAYGSVDEAVALMRAGGGDYVTKPFSTQEFLSRASTLIATRHMPANSKSLGVSQAMRKVQDLLQRLAQRPTPVLFLGDTGVGKEVCARYLHRLGAPDRPFVAVNCAAIPVELVESEIFGHEKGAFSGATALHRGYAERAGEGTLFLDEFGELPSGMQAKLLRLLDEREFTRVGGESRVPFRARVVCATNSNLEKAVAEGRFREDLLYRINVVSVSVPPLVERKEDIPWLLRRYFEQLKAEIGGHVTSISPLAEHAAMEYRWPGNIRELRNRMERAMLMASGPCLLPGDLFPERAPASEEADQRVSLRSARDEAERRLIERALHETGGHLAEAARLLEISRTTLWEKMKRYSIVIEDDA